jgi:hypothetical protein
MPATARIRRWSLPLAALMGLAATGVGPDHPPPDAQPHGFTIATVSNRPDLISGGDATVEVTVPAGVDLDRVTVRANGRDVTAALTPDPATHRLRGLVDGLADGHNELRADVRIHRRFLRWSWDQTLTAERLTVTNHPRGGPVFSGPQIEPWICATPTAQQGDATTPHTNASGLSTLATDDDCNIATEYKLWYEPASASAGCFGIGPANPCFKAYDPASPPADVATTTTDDGHTVPFVVRVERGTLNRGIYDLAVLFDPAAPGGGAPVWNGKVQHTFGGSTGSPRRQFAPQSTWFSPAPGATNDDALSRGFITSASSLTDQLLNANQVVAAETLMMLREHIVERYGSLRYVMGLGCSGGSIMQNTIASAYPGLLDGLQISCTYPDSITTATEVTDCVLLNRYFTSPEWTAATAGLTPEQINAKRAAIAGHQDERGCPSWTSAFSHPNLPGPIPDRPPAPTPRAPPFAPRADVPNNCLLPASMVFDPATNPDGLRCGAPDFMASIWGKADDPAFPGRANLTRDNVGVEYGRQALLDGAITPEEFVALNERIGSADPNGVPTTERLPADTAALRTAYRSGLVTDGRSLARVPIIDLRGNDDSGIHHDWRSFELRARLDEANGGHANHVLWRYGPTLLPPGSADLTHKSFALMDQWLSAIEADQGHGGIEEKVVRDRPAEAHDLCYLSTDTTYSNPVTDQAACDADPVLRAWASPHQVAGGPRTEDILKCRLMPFDRSRYGSVAFTDEQWARLEATFASGVCDWSKPGVEQHRAIPWSTYEQGPGGRPLGPSPHSR